MRPIRLWVAPLLLAAGLPLAACYARAEDPAAQVTAAPLELTGRVVDAAEIIPPDLELRLSDLSGLLEKDTKVQFVTVSTPSLDGMSIEEYGRALGNGWGIGDAKRNDGLLLIVAPNERKVRIEVGTGLEETLPDMDCIKVVEEMLPLFKSGDIPGGTELGAKRLDALIRERML